MRYIAFYGAIASIVLIVIATISVKHYKSTVEDYNADPDKINEKKRKKVWRRSNILCIASLAPLIIATFFSNASPLILLKQYYPMATAAGLIIAALLAAAKNIKSVLPPLKEPSQKAATSGFISAFIKGSLLILFITTIVFFVADESYRKQGIDHVLHSVTPNTTTTKSE